jgi:hypothetical protein
MVKTAAKIADHNFFHLKKSNELKVNKNIHKYQGMSGRLDLSNIVFD